MASTAAGDEFDSWLSEKLRALNTDETVFSSYIKGILEGDETDEEKNDSLGEILSEITESQIASVREEILERWSSVFRLKEREEAEAAQNKVVDVDEKLVRLLESNAKATVVVKNISEEDRKLKEAILQQYGHVADPDFEDSEEEDDASAGQNQAQSLKCMEKNTNVDVVLQADKERREKARQDAVNKKEKDKEDREKQKQAQQDRKEKRKTQKGERRR